MADIGYISLFLALLASGYSAIAYLFGVRREHSALLASARNSLFTAFGFLTVAAGALLYGLITRDFQVEYIASYTSRDLSLLFTISAWWAGNAGSLLFWAWLLSLLAVIMVVQRREMGKELVPYAAAVVMITQVFFVVLMLGVANPFHKLSFVPPDGRGLNPLLENEGMLFHPLTLLTGYVGFTIPFAFAIAALLTRRLGDEWLVVVRRWTLFAWIMLSLGNLFGAWWAYVELGWGGYWGWDPVENASLMPWLTGTAFLHSIMMQRRRGILKKWNMVLIIVTFALAIFGTFLTRSGVLASVHTFSESNIGYYYLVFISLTLLISFSLLWYRSPELKSEAEIEALVSRESTFLLNNLLIVGAAFAVFIGVIFPILSEWVRGVKITVGPPFYDQVNGPIFIAIVALAGICTLIGWRQATVKNLVHNFFAPAAIAVVAAVLLFVAGIRQVYAFVPLAICAFVFATIFSEWMRGTFARHRTKGENYLKAFFGLVAANRPRYGGYIVHIGIVLLAIGVIGSKFYAIEKEVTLNPGQSSTIGQYTITYDNIDSFETASRTTVMTSLSVYN
ncbi:MAG: heme lyase CcmF/NrfE family subunit, partial [Chloroflexi bacterium]|nr:heme lyase CcmF/NrfE family subunit [Chloroflexota bacterium]